MPSRTRTLLSCLRAGNMHEIELWNQSFCLFENQFSGNIKQSRAVPAHRPTHRCWTGLSGLWEVCEITIYGVARYVTLPLAAEQDVVVVIMKFLRCGKICMSQYQLQQHKRTHNAKQLGSMACPHCDRTFQVVNAVGLLLIDIYTSAIWVCCCCCCC